MLLWSFRSLDSSAAVLKQLLVLQLTQLRTSRTRAASSCRHRISRYQIKKPKTANFIGIKYNSQSIFTSLSHSALENNTSLLPGQQVFQGEGKKNLAENSQSLSKGSRKFPRAPGAQTPVTGNRRNVGFLLLEFGSLPISWLHGPGA